MKKTTKAKIAPKAAEAAAAKPKGKAEPVAKPSNAELITLRNLEAAISETQGLPQKQIHDVLTDAVALIKKHLCEGSRIRISGLGTLEVRERAARMGRNPGTGEEIEIKASKKVAFRAAKDLNEAI